MVRAGRGCPLPCNCLLKDVLLQEKSVQEHRESGGRGGRGRQPMHCGALLARPVGEHSWVYWPWGKTPLQPFPGATVTGSPKISTARSPGLGGSPAKQREDNSSSRGRCLSPKNERGVGPWRQRAGQSGRQPASLRLMRCPDVPASQPA